MAPAVAAARFLRGIPLGVLLGLWYGFLRPLARGRSLLRDGLFLAMVFPVWVYFSFGICDGDLQMGYFASLFVGGFLWEGTLGWYLRPFWRGVWGRFFAILGKIGKLFHKIGGFFKKIFTSAKNSCRIK